MVHYLSEKIAKRLIKTNTISQEDRELYEYAASCFLISFFPLVLSFAIGCLLRIPIESIVIILPFITIRKFSGGMHAGSPRLCFVLSCICMFILLVLAKTISMNYIILGLFVCCAILLIILSPIDSESKQLSVNEKKVFHRIAVIIVLCYVAIFFGLYLTGHEHFAMCIALGVILSSALQIPCLFVNK